MLGTLARKPVHSSLKHPNNQSKIMGDKSPKANQKKSSQKQTKTNSATQAKKQATAKKP